MTERILRSAAIVIAVLAFIDPGLTLSGSTRPRISMATSGGGAREVAVRRAVHDVLSAEFDVADGFDASADATVVVGDRYPDERFDEHARVSTVTLSPAGRPRVSLRRIVAPGAVPPTTTVPIAIDVAGEGARGITTSLSVRSAGALVASRTHAWASDSETWHADLAVVPVGDAPFVFDVRVDGSSATVAVESAARLRVLVMEARPSWASAFVRRALEDDARFDVSSVSTTSVGKRATAGAASTPPPDVRAFDAMVLGGLERFSSSDIAIVERFTKERGGVLVLLPDAAVPRPLAERFLPDATFRETLLEGATDLEVAATPGLRASELLEASDVPAEADVIARSPSTRRPIVWSLPFGDGRIVVSGALDAWRYRAGKDQDFERFWRSVISGAALAARPAIDVRISPDRAAPGERVRVSARVRSLERHEKGEQLAIAATVGNAPLRLWPDAGVGEFVGFFVASGPDGSRRRVTATLSDGVSGSADLTVDAGRIEPKGVPLSWLSQSHGGVDVTPSDLNQLAAHLRRTITAPRVAAVRQPMRSPLWIIPFAACLTAEWWLRRRRGAR